MVVALVLAVVVAVVAIALLVLRSGELRRARAELALAGERAATAELGRRDAEAAAAEREAALQSTVREVSARAEQRTAQLEAAERRLGDLHAAEQRAVEAQAAARQADERVAALEAEARAAEVAAGERIADLEAAAQAAADAAATREAELRAVEEARASLQRTLDEIGPGREPGSPAEAAVESCWRLLLARIERQWGAAVGATPAERGIVPGPDAAKLAQALQRELERLREEVGVHTDAVLAAAPAGVDPAVVLLAAGELLATLAPHSERVEVVLDEGLVVVGDGWSGDAAVVDRLRTVVADAGLSGDVDVAGDAVRVALAAPVAHRV